MGCGLSRASHSPDALRDSERIGNSANILLLAARSDVGAAKRSQKGTSHVLVRVMGRAKQEVIRKETKSALPACQRSRGDNSRKSGFRGNLQVLALTWRRLSWSRLRLEASLL
jgi:hypothetical protein